MQISCALLPRCPLNSWNAVCYKICFRYCYKICIPIAPKVPDIAPSFEVHLTSRASVTVENKPSEPPPDDPGASTAHINLHQNIQNQNNYDCESAYRPKISLKQKKFLQKQIAMN